MATLGFISGRYDLAIDSISRILSVLFVDLLHMFVFIALDMLV